MGYEADGPPDIAAPAPGIRRQRYRPPQHRENRMEKIDFICHIGYDRLHEIGATKEELVEILDEYDVAHAVLFPIGDGYIHRYREQNRELAEIAENDDRYSFFCTVNPWFGKEAERELAACFEDLGAKGVAFNTAIQGLYIDSGMIHPLIEIARRHEKPVYFYTGTPIYGLPLNLANLALKFPEVTFIMGTMGASDYWGDVVPSMRLAGNIYVETSLNTNVPAVFPGFVGEFGFDRILFGSNYPYSSYRLECEKILLCGFGAVENVKIFFDNARELLGLET